MPISNNEEDILADNLTYLWKTTMFLFAKLSTKEPSSIVVSDYQSLPIGSKILCPTTIKSHVVGAPPHFFETVQHGFSLKNEKKSKGGNIVHQHFPRMANDFSVNPN
jgi:hypothetical protein